MTNRVYDPTVVEPSLRDRVMQPEPTFHFRYAPERERLVEISRPAVLEAEVR